MKTCPICKARCFDDMEICYGCMHHFGRNDTACDTSADCFTKEVVAEVPAQLFSQVDGHKKQVLQELKLVISIEPFFDDKKREAAHK